MAVSIGICTALLPAQVAMAAQPIETLATSYLPTITETVDANQFKHPGIGFTKDMLENMRAEVRAEKEPWNTHFNMMLTGPEASRTPRIANLNGADPTKPRIYGLDSQGAEGLFIADGLTAYTQAILYYVTGDEVYRANAMRIIRLWEQMDPSKYVYYTDSHIHTGIPLQRMTGAAEILRYTSTENPDLAWTDDDTQKFSTNLITPVIQTFDNCNCRFMNQQLYTTIAKMSGSIFMGDRDGYNQAVEWFTVNKDAPDPAWTGSIRQLFRMVTKNDLTGEEVPPHVQHVEMGRDQAHGAGDLTNSEILARMMMAQGTKVDPVTGTASTDANAVGPYEFLGDRLLTAHELFGTYMVGHDIPWVPVAMSVNPDGSIRALYQGVSAAYRGRLSSSTWEGYYYYKYVRGLNMEQVAPNYTKMFSKRSSYNWGGHDGGGDYWLAIPKAAEAEGSQYLPPPIVDPYREVEDRFTALDSNSTAQNDGTASYIESTATPDGTRVAVFGYGYNATSIGFRIRTNGRADMDVYGHSVVLPNTQGEWRYVVVPVSLGDYLELNIKGAGTTVDIDHINIKASTLLSPPVFKLGNDDMTAYTYAGTTIPVTIDLSATDPAAGDVLTYKIEDLPQGASFDASTGAFSWLPTQAGTYAFVAEASDGTTVTTKRITIFVGADRQATVSAITAPFKPDTLYVTSTKTAYDAVYADMQNTIGSSTDTVYFQKLATLQGAVSGLQELTPLLPDGSINYPNLFFKSNLVTNFGGYAANGIDNINGTNIPFGTATDSNRTQTLDFGPSFKVAATAFQLQSPGSFPERVGGTTIFASNDLVNWTRITPDETRMVEEMQTLNVADEFRTQRYRFFKISMIDLLWSYNILELTEFRIFGTRYETVNKLTAVSLGSDQALRNRIVPGNTIKLTFQSSEPINNVSATIQGEPATITTADNLNWTATAVVKATTPPGPVKFLLNYKTADGTVAEPVLFPTDSSSLYIADQKNYIGNLLDITTVTDSSNRNAADALTVVNYLFDNNLNTGTDYRLNGSGNGGWVDFDFRGGGTVVLSKVEVIGLQNGYYPRIAGTVVQGSNDYTTWNTISNAAGKTQDWQTLTINDPTPYRYIRMYNPNAWFGNMTELRLYGVATSTNRIAKASLTSTQALRNRIVPGNTVTLSFTGKEAISNVSATIDGLPATVNTTDNLNFTATATLPQGTKPGPVTFAINYRTQNGSDGYQVTETTDGTSLNLVDESDLINNIPSIANLIDSTTNRSAATTLAIVNTLFDGVLSTGSDFRNGSGGSGWGAYVIFDFKAGKQVSLSSVEAIGRQDRYYGRIAGLVIQGSNDMANWDTLTPAAKATMDWQTLPAGGAAAYRYIRVYNPNQWFGTMNELRLHGSMHTAVDVTASVSISRSGLTMNRFTHKYSGSVTVTNTSTQTLTGPLHLGMQGLSAGVTLDNKSGDEDGVPYITLPVTSLAPGQKVTVTTTFSNPNKVSIGYTPVLLSIQ
jgi:hypothetical protein